MREDESSEESVESLGDYFLILNESKDGNAINTIRRRYVFPQTMYRDVYKLLRRHVVKAGIYTHNDLLLIALKQSDRELFFNLEKIAAGGEQPLRDDVFRNVKFKDNKTVGAFCKIKEYFKEGKRYVQGVQHAYKFEADMTDLDTVSFQQDEEDEEGGSEEEEEGEDLCSVDDDVASSEEEDEEEEEDSSVNTETEMRDTRVLANRVKSDLFVRKRVRGLIASSDSEEEDKNKNNRDDDEESHVSATSEENEERKKAKKTDPIDLLSSEDELSD